MIDQRELTDTHERGLQRIAQSLDETRAFAGEIAHTVASAGGLLLSGPLGAGKTSVVQGLLSAWGYPGQGRSPSFIIQQLYVLPPGSPSPGKVVEHVDLYRLREVAFEELQSLLRELEEQGDILLIEWPEPLLAHGWHQELPLLTIDLLESEGAEPARELTLWLPRDESGGGA